MQMQGESWSVDCDEMREIQADADAGMFHRIQDLREWVTRMDAGRHGFFTAIWSQALRSTVEFWQHACWLLRV